MNKNFLSTILKIVFIIILNLLLTGCNGCTDPDKESKIIHEKKQVYINDYNILLVPDLSNRINPDIHPKPVQDSLLINNILDHTSDILQLQNRTTNVLDVYKIDFINRGILNDNVVKAKELELNFRRFKGNLLGASEYKRNELKRDINIFKNNIKNIYSYAISNPSGSDIWNYFNETVIPNVLPENGEEADLTTADIKLIKKNKNVVVLFTDGYIENINQKKGYTLDQKLINSIRSSYQQSKADNLEKFILSHPEYHLKPTENNLNSLNILIFEIIDRSLDSNGVAKYQPTDFQIIKILWTKWLNDSGCRNIEIHQAFNKKEEAYEKLSSFLEKLK
ncbi:MAG: hypothetical protein E2590_01660 [Chryseobacterium sp.]|nr:hypothetical protein [Chryseobacterium sp.]